MGREKDEMKNEIEQGRTDFEAGLVQSIVEVVVTQLTQGSHLTRVGIAAVALCA